MRIIALSTALILGLSQVAQAATLSESAVAAGFSSDFSTPTTVAAGTTSIDGTLAQGDFDFLQLTGLSAGAQTLFFLMNLSAPSGLTGNQAASGEIRVSDAAFTSAFDGTRINPSAGVNDFELSFDLANLASSVPFQALSYNLAPTFAGGDLYLSILPTFATQVFSFGIAVPSAPIAPAPVPVPAAGLMLMAALSGMALWRRRKPDMLPA